MNFQRALRADLLHFGVRAIRQNERYMAVHVREEAHHREVQLIALLRRTNRFVVAAAILSNFSSGLPRCSDQRTPFSGSAEFTAIIHVERPMADIISRTTQTITTVT